MKKGRHLSLHRERRKASMWNWSQSKGTEGAVGELQAPLCLETVRGGQGPDDKEPCVSLSIILKHRADGCAVPGLRGSVAAHCG